MIPGLAYPEDLRATFPYVFGAAAEKRSRIRLVAMSVDLQGPMDVEPVRTALDEVRATEEEFSQFFGNVFDQLQGLSLEVFARHKCLEIDTDCADLREVREGFRQIAGEFSGIKEELKQMRNLLESK